MNDRELSIWLAEAARREGEGTGDCPPLERLLAFASGPVAAGERERLGAHLVGCPACAAEVALARELAAPVDADDPDVAAVVERLQAGRAAEGGSGLQLDPRRPAGPPVATGTGPAGSATSVAVPVAVTAPAIVPANAGTPSPTTSLRPRRRSTAPRFWRGLAAAALGLVAVGLIVTRPSAPPLPAPPSEVTVRGQVMVPIEPLGDLADWPVALRWQVVGDASRYRVTLQAVDGTVLAAVTTTAAEVPLAGALREGLHRAVTYRWRVVAESTAGEVLATSPELEFRVLLAPPPSG